MQKLHSVHTLIDSQNITGSFDVEGQAYRLTFTPVRAEISGGRLHLHGSLTVLSRSGERRAEGVRATLASSQGGVGVSPARAQLLAGTVQTGTTSTSTEKQAEEGESSRSSSLPGVDASGKLSHAGVLFFHLSPLDSKRLGVPLDMSRVQLNLRLAPVDQKGRDLHYLYSVLVTELYTTRQVDSSILKAINKTLGSA
jgi:hypothetical protein